MNFLKTHYKRVIKREILNKFLCKNLNNLPQINKIILNFEIIDKYDFKYLSLLLLAFELITTKSGDFTTSKKSNIRINLKRGFPIGCKIILKKKIMYYFLTKLLIEIFPNLKNLKKLNFLNKNNIKFIAYQLSTNNTFFEVKNNYFLFANLPNLNITFVTATTKDQNELYFLFHSLKLPIKKVF